MDSLKNLSGIWLTFKNNEKSAIDFKSGFQNIKLQKKNTKEVVNLYALLMYNKNYCHKMEAKKYSLSFKKGSSVNMVMIFPDAEKGDRIIIDDFLEAEVQ